MAELYDTNGRNIGTYDKSENTAYIRGEGRLHVDEDGYAHDSNGNTIGRINDSGYYE